MGICVSSMGICVSSMGKCVSRVAVQYKKKLHSFFLRVARRSDLYKKIIQYSTRKRLHSFFLRVGFLFCTVYTLGAYSKAYIFSKFSSTILIYQAGCYIFLNLKVKKNKPHVIPSYKLHYYTYIASLQLFASKGGESGKIKGILLYFYFTFSHI